MGRRLSIVVVVVVVVVLVLVPGCRLGFEPGADGTGDESSDEVADGTRDATEDDDQAMVERGSWVVSAFGPCSLTCTTGDQSRTVECHSDEGNLLGDERCANEKPLTTRACEESDCVWLTEPWSDCPVRCDGGTQERGVACRSASGLVNPDAYCTGTRPADAQTCNTAACCPDLGNTIHELPGDGEQACGGNARYFTSADDASMMQRCQELGYARYGDFNVEFTQARWCMYCNARTKIWDGTEWNENGCTNPVDKLRCCNDP